MEKLTEEKIKEVVGKLEKILELSNPDSGATEHERATAARRAEEIMNKYNLAYSDIKEARDVDKGKIGEWEIDGMGNNEYYKRNLASGIAKAFNCRMLFYRGRSVKFRLIFIGTPAEAGLCSFFYNRLMTAIQSNCFIHQETQADFHPSDYKKTFSGKIVERLNDLYAVQHDVTTDSNTTAIVLAKDSAIKEYVKDKYPKVVTSKTRVTRPTHRNSVGLAITDAENTRLDRPISGGNERSNQLDN